MKQLDFESRSEGENYLRSASEGVRLAECRKPRKLPLSKLTAVPKVFQIREACWGDGKTELASHVSDLMQHIKTADKHNLDPILVWQAREHLCVVDGHHRVQAYGGFCDENDINPANFKVPIKFIEGSLEDALVAAREANKKVSLSLTPSERMNTVWWEVVRSYSVKGGWSLSKKDTQKSGLAGLNTIARMRNVCVKLIAVRRKSKDHLLDMPWCDARREATEGKSAGLDYEEFEDEEARKLAASIGKAFGQRLVDNPGVTLKALEFYSSNLMRRMGEAWAEDNGWVLPEGDSGIGSMRIDDPDSDF